MKWDDYYERFYDWEESTQLSRISSLTDFNSTDEIIEISENFDEKGASKLFCKALSQGVSFSAENILDICEYVDKNTTVALINKCSEKFMPEQIEQICSSTLLFEDEVKALLRYNVPEEDDIDDDILNDCDVIEPELPKLGFLGSIGLGLLVSDFVDKYLFDDDDKGKDKD